MPSRNKGEDSRFRAAEVGWRGGRSGKKQAGSSTAADTQNAQSAELRDQADQKLTQQKSVQQKTVPFDPSAPELATSWHSSARLICCINTYPNGISFSVHKNDSVEDEHTGSIDLLESTGGEAAIQEPAAQKSKFTPSQFHLRLRDTRDLNVPTGRYFLYREKYAQALEHNLAQLYKKDLLASTVIYLGMSSDPFLALDKKFDVTHACLELLSQYRPGLLVAQTRSPMVISALPLLKMLGDRAVVAMPIESPQENIIARYTPGQPRIRERLIAAEGLRRQGIQVNLMASPVLPYGDFYRDAWDFAAMLSKHADFVSLGSLYSGVENEESMLRLVPLAQRLAADRQFRWLRPYSFRCLYYALKSIAPEKLLLPARVRRESAQLKLFAA